MYSIHITFADVSDNEYVASAMRAIHAIPGTSPGTIHHGEPNKLTVELNEDISFGEAGRICRRAREIDNIADIELDTV